MWSEPSKSDNEEMGWADVTHLNQFDFRSRAEIEWVSTLAPSQMRDSIRKRLDAASHADATLLKLFSMKPDKTADVNEGYGKWPTSRESQLGGNPSPPVYSECVDCENLENHYSIGRPSRELSSTLPNQDRIHLLCRPINLEAQTLIIS